MTDLVAGILFVVTVVGITIVVNVCDYIRQKSSNSNK
jgi:hypothetical protein